MDMVFASVPLEVVLVPGLLVMMPLIWCGVIFLISQIGGWARLAQAFPATEMPKGEVLGWQSAQLQGWCNYNRVLTFVISEEGLYMRPWGLFRMGHAPVLIPWGELKNPRARRLFWVEQVVFDVGEPRVVKLCLEKKPFEKFPVDRSEGL